MTGRATASSPISSAPPISSPAPFGRAPPPMVAPSSTPRTASPRPFPPTPPPPATPTRRPCHGDFIEYVGAGACGQLIVRRPPTEILDEGSEGAISFSPKHCVLLQRGQPET